MAKPGRYLANIHRTGFSFWAITKTVILSTGFRRFSMTTMKGSGWTTIQFYKKVETIFTLVTLHRCGPKLMTWKRKIITEEGRQSTLWLRELTFSKVVSQRHWIKVVNSGTLETLGHRCRNTWCSVCYKPKTKMPPKLLRFLQKG